MFHLVVTHAFGDYQVGDTITDADKIEAALARNAAFVVRITAPETPAAAAPVDNAK